MKHLCILLAALWANSGFAQIHQVPEKLFSHEDLTVEASARKLSVKAPQKVTLNPVTDTPVYDEPQGTKGVASLSTTGIFYYYGYVLDQATDHVGISYIETDDALWINQPFTQYYESDYGAVGRQGWLRLDKTETGYVCQLPQAIISGTDGKTYYATRMTGSASSMEYKAASNSAQKVTFTVDEKGVISQKYMTGTEIIGLTDINGNWTAYGNYGYEIKPNHDIPVAFPEDMVTERYVWTNDITADGSTFDQFINVAIIGNDVYFSNVADDTQYFKGTIEGNKCIVKNNQYMGLSELNGYIFYIRGCKFSWKKVADENGKTYNMSYLGADEDIVFDFDPATKSFCLPEGYAICANVDMADDYFKNLSPNLKITPFVEKAATPVDPYVYLPESYYSDYQWFDSYGMGYGYVEVVISSHDAEGNYLDPDKMYYRMYIDDEEHPYVFTSDFYNDMPEDAMTEIPLNLSTYEILMYSPSLRLIFFGSDVAQRIGFQSVYYGGGEVHESQIGWYYPEHEMADSSNFSDKTVAFGTNKKENYGVAVSLKDPALVGMTVTQVTVPFGTSIKGLTNGKVFLTKELKLENHQNVADIAVQDFTIKAGNVIVTLDEPYTIPEGGIYVGYTFDEDQLVKTPLQVVNKANPGNLYLFTSSTYWAWGDRSERLGLSTAMKVTLSSENATAASPSFEGVTTQIGDKPQITITVNNHGSEAISSIDYSWVEGSLSGTKHVTFSKAIPAELGASSTTKLTLPAQIEDGNIPLTITIDKVNDQPNKDANPSATATMKVYSFIPTYRPLMEEYTGTGCGWCPRGLVGLDNMIEIYEDEFVGISYHQYNADDPMYFGSEFSNAVSGFPSAYFNRNHRTDAYYGDSNTGGFGLDKTFEEIRKDVIAPADVWANAHYTSTDGFKIEATASTLFPLAEANGHYAFALIAIANGLSGSAKAWFQANYYSGNNDLPADLQLYGSAGSYYSKQVYNLVALDWTGKSYVKNSVPKTIDANTAYDYTHTFNLSSKSAIIKDKKDVQIVVALIDTTDGHVVNANKVDVMTYEDYTGIDVITAGNAKTITAIYGLDGKRQMSLKKGLNILRHEDGSVTKRIVR